MGTTEALCQPTQNTLSLWPLSSPDPLLIMMGMIFLVRAPPFVINVLRTVSPCTFLVLFPLSFWNFFFKLLLWLTAIILASLPEL